MEDFKVIFYIAIGIAWFVYKNYQKVQQNRPKTILPPVSPPISTATDRKINVTEKLKPVILTKKVDLKKDFKTYPKNKQTRDEIKKKTYSGDLFLKTEADHPVSAEKKVAETNAVAKDFAEEDLFDLKKFDIRTAIIYSEILKRPYV